MRREGDQWPKTPEDAQELLGRWKKELPSDDEKVSIEHIERTQKVIAGATGVQAEDEKKSR